MRESLLELLESTGQLTAEAIVARLAAASVLACFIFLSYWLSHDGSIYSKKFNISLVALTSGHDHGHDSRSATTSRCLWVW